MKCNKCSGLFCQSHESNVDESHSCIKENVRWLYDYYYGGQATLNVLPPSSNSLCGFKLNTKYIEPQFHGLVLYIGVGIIVSRIA